jgi:hypothetical protein
MQNIQILIISKSSPPESKMEAEALSRDILRNTKYDLSKYRIMMLRSETH